MSYFLLLFSTPVAPKTPAREEIDTALNANFCDSFKWQSPTALVIQDGVVNEETVRNVLIGSGVAEAQNVAAFEITGKAVGAHVTVAEMLRAAKKAKTKQPKKEAAQVHQKDLVDIDPIFSQFAGIIKNLLASRKVNKSLNIYLEERRHIAIVGGQGTGKHWLADTVAQTYREEGVVNKKARIRTVSFYGETPPEETTGIIDENLREDIDSYEQNKTVFVLNDLPILQGLPRTWTAIQSIVFAEDSTVVAVCRDWADLVKTGMADEFTHILHLPVPSLETLTRAVLTDITASGLRAEKGLDEQIHALLKDMRDQKTGSFGNGHESDRIFDALAVARTKRLANTTADFAKRLTAQNYEQHPSEAEMAVYKTVTAADLPVYDSKTDSLYPQPQTKDVAARRATFRVISKVEKLTPNS